LRDDDDRNREAEKSPRTALPLALHLGPGRIERFEPIAKSANLSGQAANRLKEVILLLR
jgi:hypothetical protein